MTRTERRRRRRARRQAAVAAVVLGCAMGVSLTAGTEPAAAQGPPIDAGFDCWRFRFDGPGFSWPFSDYPRLFVGIGCPIERDRTWGGSW